MKGKINFDYYYGIEAEQFAFYRVPRLLIKDERFKGLSSDAKLLYGLMLDRMSLSMKNGWLDAKEYAPAARKAWMAMVKYIDENNNVKSVCEGTNKKNDKQYYYDRKQNVGDYHGQAPYLWCAVALLEE